MSLPFPEPAIPVSSRTEVFLGYLDYFRSRLVSKLEALPGGELRRAGCRRAGRRSSCSSILPMTSCDGSSGASKAAMSAIRGPKTGMAAGTLLPMRHSKSW